VITGKINISRESLSSLEVGHKPPYFLYENLPDKIDDFEKERNDPKNFSENKGQTTSRQESGRTL
jgi:hypothetical protein